MNRNDYDDRRRRPLTGLGPEYQNAVREPSDSRFPPNRSLRMQTLSLEEAVDRHRSRSPYGGAAAPHYYGRKRSPAGAPHLGGGGLATGGPALGASTLRHHPAYHHSVSGPPPQQQQPPLPPPPHRPDAGPPFRPDAAPPFRPEWHHSRGERRAEAADFVVPQDMATTFEQYERPMDPRAFREECRKAYMEAAAARQRNAEMSVWGRCSWATYDKYDPRNRTRRQ